MPFEEPGSWQWCLLLPTHIRILALVTATSGLLVFLSAVVGSLRLLRRSQSTATVASRYMHFTAIASAGIWLLAAAYNRFIVTARILRNSRVMHPGDYTYIEHILNRDFSFQATIAAAVIVLSFISLGLWRRVRAPLATRTA